MVTDLCRGRHDVSKHSLEELWESIQSVSVSAVAFTENLITSTLSEKATRRGWRTDCVEIAVSFDGMRCGTCHEDSGSPRASSVESSKSVIVISSGSTCEVTLAV